MEYVTLLPGEFSAVIMFQDANMSFNAKVASTHLLKLRDDINDALK